MPTTLEVKTPRLVTALPGPNAKRVLEQDAKFMSPSYTRDYPLVAKRGHGAMVEDVDGNTFLDFAAGIAVCSTGHCHPKVVAAIQKDHARGGKQESFLYQLWDRSNRRRHQAGKVRHQARQIHRILRLLPRPVDGRALADGVQINAAQGIRGVAQWNRAHPISLRLPLRARAYHGDLRCGNSRTA